MEVARAAQCLSQPQLLELQAPSYLLVHRFVLYSLLAPKKLTLHTAPPGRACAAAGSACPDLGHWAVRTLPALLPSFQVTCPPAIYLPMPPAASQGMDLQSASLASHPCSLCPETTPTCAAHLLRHLMSG